MRLTQTLYTAEAIAARVHELGAGLRDALGLAPLAAAPERAARLDADVVVVGLLRGAIFFYVDLIRAIGHPSLRLDLVHVSSYASDGEAAGRPGGSDPTVPSGTVTFDPERLATFSGKRVLLLDDIVDTGRTLRTLRGAMLAAGARSVVTAVLLDKRGRRVVDFAPDFVGFEVPDHFVVGYGLDCAGAYRTLPDIRVVEPDEPGVPEASPNAEQPGPS